MTSAVPALESAVSRFLTGFAWRDVDARSLESVTTLLKDQLAVQIGVSQLPWSRQVRRALRHPRPGNSTVIAERTTMDAGDAAYLNAVYGGGFEYDDVAGNAHPGCCVVPVALAVGEEVGANLRQVLEAMIAGYEVYVRLGYLGAPDLVKLGWHPHAVLANFGAAAVAAKLHRLDGERSHHALAMALSYAGGTTEYTATGGSIKRVHAGIAARNGIQAVTLAQGGLTGPLAYLSGDKGFYRTFIHRPAAADASAIFAPGQALRINDAWLKAYCCCGAHHAYVDAMARARHRAQDILAVEARIQSTTAGLAGHPDVQVHGPRNIEELQFSLPIQMALSALGMGNGYGTHVDYLRGALRLDGDSEALQLARRIELHRSPELDERHPRNFVADVTIRYRDGTSEQVFVENAKGMPGNPFTPAEHRSKVDELARAVFDEGHARRLFGMLDELDLDRPVGELTALLRRD